MAQKRWIITLFSFLLVALTFTGYLAIAAGQGTKDDPLVTVSYISNVLTPNLNKTIDTTLTQKTQDYTDKLTKRYDELAASLGAASSGSFSDDFINMVAEAIIAKQNAAVAATGTSEAMKKVTIVSGKTVTLSLGSEVLLRLGNATCVATDTPGLIDTTSGSDLANGKALEKNHLYMCTVDGRGFKCSNEVTVFIRGGYTVK